MSRKKEEERIEQVVRSLSKLAENRKCINCNNAGTQYVCINFATFVCTACSGIHREFTHRIKSISMAKFTAEDISTLQQGGNERGKLIYFKDWDPRKELPSSSEVARLRDLIREVYVERRYSGGKLPVSESSSRRPADASQREGNSASAVPISTGTLGNLLKSPSGRLVSQGSSNEKPVLLQRTKAAGISAEAAAKSPRVSKPVDPLHISSFSAIRNATVEAQTSIAVKNTISSTTADRSGGGLPSVRPLTDLLGPQIRLEVQSSNASITAKAADAQPASNASTPRQAPSQSQVDSPFVDTSPSPNPNSTSVTATVDTNNSSPTITITSPTVPTTSAAPVAASAPTVADSTKRNEDIFSLIDLSSEVESISSSQPVANNVSFFNDIMAQQAPNVTTSSPYAPDVTKEKVPDLPQPSSNQGNDQWVSFLPPQPTQPASPFPSSPSTPNPQFSSFPLQSNAVPQTNTRREIPADLFTTHPPSPYQAGYMQYQNMQPLYPSYYSQPQPYNPSYSNYAHMNSYMTHQPYAYNNTHNQAMQSKNPFDFSPNMPPTTHVLHQRSSSFNAPVISNTNFSSMPNGNPTFTAPASVDQIHFNSYQSNSFHKKDNTLSTNPFS